MLFCTRAFLPIALVVLWSPWVNAQDWQTINQAGVRAYQSGDYEEAIRLSKQAEQLASQSFGQTSHQYLTSLNNEAYAHAGAGDSRLALTNFGKAAELSFVVFPLPHFEQAQAVSELSKAYLNLFLIDSAEHYINLANYILSTIPTKNKPHYDTAYHDIMAVQISVNGQRSSIQHKKGLTLDAIEILESQLDLFRALYTNYEDLHNYRVTLSNLCVYYLEVGEAEKAAHYANAYYKMVKGDEEDRLHALQNLGSIAWIRDQPDSALHYWHTAIDLAEAGHYRRSHLHAVLLNNMGELLVQQEQYDSAIQVLEKSLAIQNEKASVQPYLYRTTLFNLAEACLWSQHYERADSLYGLVMRELVDDITHNFTYLNDREKMAFYNAQLDIVNSYHFLALTVSGVVPLQKREVPYINPGIGGDMYDLQLNTKAIILNSGKRMRDQIMNSGDSVLTRIYNLWEGRKYELAQVLVSGTYTKQEIEPLERKIEENEKWLTEHSRNFQQGFSREKVAWQQVQQALKPGEAAVELVKLMDGLLYAALILTPETREQPVLSIVSSTKSKHLDRQLFQNYRNAILFQLDDTLSYATYWKPIIDSIRQHLPHGEMPRRVFVSMDGVYNSLNLYTLHNPETGKYVIDETEIVLLTNTKELLRPKKVAKDTRRTAALFGQPDFSKSSGTFENLPGTGVEVQKISDAFRKSKWESMRYVQEEATEENLKRLESPTVLHIASHGYFRSSESGHSIADMMVRSGVVLTAGDTAQSREDGMMTAYELMNLDLDDTRIVVLSACETARGAVNAGEGVYGLQRAVRVAGAENLIMSLWKVDDQATQELMVDFYRLWLKSDDISASFKQAQLTLRKKYPSPYYWGAFVLAGR